MTEYLEAIPAKIASKVEDKDWSQTFIFEQMPCLHGENALPHEKVNCEKCKIDAAEKWAEDTLTKLEGNETTKDEDGNTKALQKIKVVRGKYDDCIGFEWHWG